MSYSNCVVFFIDILGSRDREDFEVALKINQMFHKKLEGYSKRDFEHTAYKRVVHTFSDCAYIIYDFKEGIDESRKDISALAKIALYNTEFLICELIAERFIVRGGVTIGDVYYEENRSLVFGPAISRAYYLESKIAIYPRIVVDKCIVDKFIESENQINEQAKLKGDFEFIKYRKSINGEILLEDFDGLYHLNYLNSYRLNLMNDKYFKIEDYLENDIIMNMNQYNSKPKILMKHEWLKKYYNSSKEIRTNLFLNFS
jgi:hypothetical protein